MDKKEMRKRWDKIRIANLYDALDQMGYPDQCLEVTIKPLIPGQRLSGVAVTFSGSKGPEYFPDDYEKTGKEFFEFVNPYLEDDCVIVIDAGGEKFTGKMGEMTSWFFKKKGASGLVVDGYIRDYDGLRVIPDYTVCSRGTSPVESASRWHVSSINNTIALPGTITMNVNIHPGDWIVGGADGVIVVPKEISEAVLLLAEEIEIKEEGMRQDLLSGLEFDKAFEKWGRA